MKELNRYSKQLTQNDSLPAAQAMLYGIGMRDEDFSKPLIGIASTGYEGNTCNMHLNDLAKQVKKGITDQGLVGLIFNTIGVSDGISNGTRGMRYSLVSREIIADSIESVVQAHYYDGLVAVVGCDKNMPGAVIAMARLNRPSIMMFGGTIMAGCYKEEKLNIISAFEAYGKKLKNEISDQDYKGIIKNSCPGAGACGGMYTANTMSSAIEALGLALPFNSSNPAVSKDKKQEYNHIARAMRLLLEKDIKPKDILTKQAFINAITLVILLGGSTNATLHLLAMAHAIDVSLTLDEFQEISDKTPLLADMKPSGEYLMEDLYAVGGIPAVMKYLLAHGFINGDCLTVTGKTISENLSEVEDLSQGQDVIRTLKNPIKKTGHLQILYGNLAKRGAVAKITGKEGELFEGRAIVFDSEDQANEGILNGDVKTGNVVVIRYEGPKGAPGMPEMLKPTSSIMGANLGKHVALITDGRFSGGSHGFVVGHITPEAQEAGVIALVKNDDTIRIDAVNNTIDVLLSEEELEERRKKWKPKVLSENRGTLYKYAHLVSSASEGCVTDKF